MKKIIVVGGVAGGASFAARMRRLDETAQIIMFEKGEYISFANCGLPYHIGETIAERDNLIIQTPKQFKARFNIDVRIKSEVTQIDTSKSMVTVNSGELIYEESYDYLVLSPGAEPVRPPIPGIDSKKIYSLRTIPDMDRIKQTIESSKVTSAAVIGGGFIGLEMAENLHKRGISVTQIELLDQVFAPADHEMAHFIHQHIRFNGVRLMLENGAQSFTEKENGVDVTLKSGEILNFDIVILAIGVKPDTGFVKQAGIAVNERGAIIVDFQLRTNVKNIYALGDAIEVTDLVSGQKVHIPLAGPANRQGRIVADNINGINSIYKDTQGTAICKIFDLTAAVTGINEKTAKKLGIKYLKSYTHSQSHASYYPGAYPLSVKILFTPDTGKLLGAQIIGKIGVDKRIDVFATAIRHGLTVGDLSELELSYAPPYGSAKDAVNIAGFTAQNILNGIVKVVYPEDLEKIKDNCTLLDVRSEIENEQGEISGCKVIPLDDLRSRMNELDKSKPVVVYCAVGLRGYLAARILMQNGFVVSNLSGGYKTYSAYIDKESDSESVKNNNVPVSMPVVTVNESMVDAKLSVNACGLQCPGPIMKLKQAIDKISVNEIIEISANEQGFVADIPSWCTRTGNSLLSLDNKDGVYVAKIRKGCVSVPVDTAHSKTNRKTMVIFSNDFDKAMAAFIIANGAAATGSEVVLFFTFWGLNLLRKEENVSVKKNLMEKMFGLMMPKGASKVKLSKMHMGGMGTIMIKQVMKKKNVFSLSELIDEARKNKIRFVACSMSMDIMGIKNDELMDGVEIGGVATYLENADNSNYNLFI